MDFTGSHWLQALLALPACSKIPQGRSAVDSVSVHNTVVLQGSDVQDKLATAESEKFLFLFQGLAYDYSIYDEAVLQRDMARVERYYRSRGLFDAHARVARVFQINPKHVRVQIVVDEGKPTVNRSVHVAGADGLPKGDATAVAAAANAAVPVGDRFDEEKLKNSEATVKKALTDRGYAYATATVQAEVDIGQHVADYGFRVVPGPLATFGPVTIVGLDPAGSRQQEIPEAPLYRAMDVKQGTPYSTAEIDSATQALLDLEVFSSVHIEPQLPQPPPEHPVIPLVVRVEPTRLRQLTFGGGIEIDEIKTDLHAVAGWEDHNFLGGLRDFSVNAKPGVVLYPVRINNFHGPLHPLPEVWFKTELRQPGVSRGTHHRVRPTSVQHLPVARRSEPTCRRSRRWLPGDQSSHWIGPHLLSKALRGHRLHGSGREPVCVRPSPGPWAGNGRPLLSGARHAPRPSRQLRPSAQGRLHWQHRSGRWPRRHRGRRPRAARSPDVHPHHPTA